jgi:hypothetical protein
LENIIARRPTQQNIGFFPARSNNSPYFYRMNSYKLFLAATLLVLFAACSKKTNGNNTTPATDTNIIGSYTGTLHQVQTCTNPLHNNDTVYNPATLQMVKTTNDTGFYYSCILPAGFNLPAKTFGFSASNVYSYSTPALQISIHYYPTGDSIYLHQYQEIKDHNDSTLIFYVTTDFHGKKG